MTTLELVVVIAVVLLGLVAIAGWVIYRTLSARARAIARRIEHLPLRAKLRLALRLTTDERLPTAIRLIPPLVVLYLALPIDIVPDFIPILGQLDDVLVIVLGAGLLVRFTPGTVIESHLAALEAEEEARAALAAGEPTVRG